MIVPNNTKIYQLRIETSIKTLFKPKEIEILEKVLECKPLTKTERERYSRKIKKKVNAMIDFYELAILLRDAKNYHHKK